ncbi:MAG: PBP1A family penicillin-binding protein [Candidatus Paceibacterota bacterium]
MIKKLKNKIKNKAKGIKNIKIKNLKFKKHHFLNAGLVFLVLGVFAVGVSIIWVATLRVPDFKSFDERRVVRSTKIYDRTEEEVLFDIHQDIKRTIIPFEDMGDNIKEATLAIEDKDFYKHKGVQPKAFIRAIFVNLKSGSFSQGGSTITQQVVKNSLLTNEKRISRKLKEWFLALKLEKEMSKEDILATYLNEIPYGGNIYGVKEAANYFFSKNPIDLTLAEAAYLAAIPKAPTYYSPYGKNKELTDARKNLVLSEMFNQGRITEEQYTEAKAEEVEFLPQSRFSIKAPHFVFYIREYLEQKYGADVVESGGLKVVTTLNYEMHQKAEEVVYKHAKENEELYNASNAGLVAIDPNTGEILTMVGSRNYFDEEIDGKYNIATAQRQPGSSFKPFIYVTAMMKGFTPNSVLFDTKTEFQTTCSPQGFATSGSQSNCYSPSNYDDIYKGPITLRQALGESRNVPAVKLLYLVTINDALKTAKNMGIKTLKDANQYGLTLVLGGGEVSLLDMTSAYGVFATEGVRHEPVSILRVEDSNGNILEEHKEDRGQTVIDANSARIISDMLSDNVARTPLYGANSFIYFGERDVAGKTGTTNNNKDAWMMGYAPNLAVGVWSGNNDNTPMKKGSAISGRLWREFMDFALTKVSRESFTPPFINDSLELKPLLRGNWLGGESVLIDSISGKLATEFTPEETLKEITVTDVHNELHWIDRVDPTGPNPENPGGRQYENWEYAVQNWWNLNKSRFNPVREDDIPTSYDNIHTEQNKPEITIEHPTRSEVYPADEPIFIQLDYDTEYPVESFDIFVNNTYLGNTKNLPFNFSFTPSSVENIQEVNELRVIIRDEVFNKSEASVSFSVNI